MASHWKRAPRHQRPHGLHAQKRRSKAAEPFATLPTAGGSSCPKRLRHYEALTSWRREFCGHCHVWCGAKHPCRICGGAAFDSLHIDGNRFHALSQAWRSLRGPCPDARKVALVDCIRSAKLLLLRIATAAVLLILFVELYRLTAGYEALGIYQSITHTTSTTRLNTSIDRLPYR